MRTTSLTLLVIVLLSLAAFTGVSQIQINEKISLDEKETCKNVTYEEVESVFGECSENYNHCLNTSGPNTGCSLASKNWTCKTGTQNVQKQKKECISQNKYEIDVKGVKKELDHVDFGPCAHEEQAGCLIVTCVSEEDGAHNGEFVGCHSGMSCQKFEICENSIKSYVRNSRDDFVESDASFYLEKMKLKGVGQ